MRSNIRVFKERGFTARGNVLPIDQFKLYSDLSERVFDEGMAREIIKKAEEMLERPIEMMTLSLYRDFFLTGVRSRFEKLTHEREDMTFYLAMAEMYERKGRFTAKLADVIWSLLEQSEWVLPAHYYQSPTNPRSTVPAVYKEDTVPALELYSSGCCGFLSMVAYFLKDELDAISPIIVKRIKHEVYLRGIRPYITSTFTWTGDIPGFVNNWLTNITQNILVATALTADDLDVRERVVDRAMHYLDNFTAYYPEDGACDEGPAYWGAAPGNLFDSLEIIEDMTAGKITVYDHPLIRKMGEYVVNLNIHHNTYVCFADARPGVEHDGKMIMRYGEKCQSRDLYAFGKRLAYYNRDNRYYFAAMAYRNIKNFFIPRVTEECLTEAKSAVWYEGNKVAILRESPDTSKGLFLAVKGGHNAEMHNHNDVGCIVIYADGKPLIPDPSHGSYDNGFFGATRYDRWFMKSSYHSIPTVDGIVESVGAEYSSSSEIFDPESKTVTMELGGAFPGEAGIISMRRTVGMADSCITVKDEVHTDHEAEICFNYLIVNEPKLIGEHTLDIGEGRTFSYEANGVELIVERVENTYLPYDDLNFKAIWQRDCLWRIVLRAQSDKKTVVACIR